MCYCAVCSVVAVAAVVLALSVFGFVCYVFAAAVVVHVFVVF